MAKQSAGLLVYRLRSAQLEVFLVHPGGPFWARKDDGAWSIPKGELASGEEPLLAAQREFTEETGFQILGPFVSLQAIKQAGGKIVQAFAASAELDPGKLVSNVFSLEWPPRSGQVVEFPEADRAAWFPLEAAKTKIIPAQVEFLVRLERLVNGNPAGAPQTS
jgi:predicted NUDIX family NTP pyrophosphohydrolase